MSNTIYCTYLTIYKGNKLPPLYIGSTSVDKINNGYHGSVSSKKYKEIWLLELSNNPHLFETKILTTHSTREEAFEEEIRYQIEHNVVRSPEYINMSIANGKLLAQKGIKKSEEHRKKMSEAGKNRWKDPEIRKKKSESMKGKTLTEESRKNLSESKKGKKRKPFTEEHRKKMSEAQKKRFESEEERKKIERKKNSIAAKI